MRVQKEALSIKHKEIWAIYSEKLKEKYEANFNQSLRYFESQTSTLKSRIKTLTEELEMAKLAILSVGTRKPVYSPGKYVDSGLDNSRYCARHSGGGGSGAHYQFPNLAYMYTLYSTLTLFTFYIVTHTLNKGTVNPGSQI